MVLARGGANRARFFTKLWLAVLGRYPWSALPGAAARDDPAAAARAPMSPYRFASWARGTFVALMIVLSRNPTFPQPVGLDELFLEPPGRGPAPRPKTPGPVDPGADAQPDARRGSTTGARSAPLRRAGRGAGRALDLERQEADGSWGGIQPPWVYSILALHALGLPLDHPVIARGAGRLRRRVRASTSTTASACASRRACRPSGTRALAAVALADAGAAPGDPALDAAAGVAARARR